jgi:hypothetical protein
MNKIFHPFYVQFNRASLLKKIVHQNGRRESLQAHGFYSDHTEPPWKRVEEVLGNMTKFQYFNRPQHMAFHNLCSQITPPKGIGATLGLSLKFCIQSKLPPPNFEKSFEQFIDDVRKKFMSAGTFNSFDTPKKLYIKSEWIPDNTQQEHMESRLKAFWLQMNQIKKLHQQNATPSTNLTNLQQQHINFLQNNNNNRFIILNADKNLGPCIMERKCYIQHILQEHLQADDTYSHLQEEAALDTLNNICTTLNSILKEHEKSMPKVEHEYFNKCLMQPTRVPQFYGMPKVHKNKKLMPFRPVISQYGSLSAFISTYIDHKLQSFTPSIPSYIKNSTSLLNKLDRIKQLPPGCKL